MIMTLLIMRTVGGRSDFHLRSVTIHTELWKQTDDETLGKVIANAQLQSQPT